MSYRGRGRGGFHPNNGNRGNPQQNIDQYVAANSVPVEILGWNGATPDDCVRFISRKCKIIVNRTSVDPATGVLKGYVKTPKEADELCTWSGVKFAGQSLKITKGTSQDALSTQMGQSSGGSTIEVLTQFIRSRYDQASKLLNLSSVLQDPTLVAKGFFASMTTTSKFFPALMKVCKELNLDVTSIDLSGNNLSDLATISSLPPTFPYLRNLSLVNNNFSKVRAFETWKHKLNYLRELVLIGNPLFSNPMNPNEQTTKVEIMRLFPRLIVLNGEIVRNEQVLANILTFPFDEPQPMFFSDEEIQNMSTNFIANYYKLWDANRRELLVLYEPNSQFSMQVDSAHPHNIDLKPQGYHGNTDFGYYLHQSRNLARISSAKSRISRIATGQEQIFKLFSQLPKTRHDLLSHPHLYSMESYRFPQLNGIMIVFHGTFEETAPPDVLDNSHNDSSTKNRFSHSRNKKIALSAKSFDRTFIVIPGPNGRMIVASDLLSIRAEGGSSAWHPSDVPKESLNTPPNAAPAPTAATPSVSDLPPEVKANLSPMQQEILVKTLLETRLNLQYGIMLCEQSNWDYNQCTINFKNSAASLPRDAYVS